MMETQCKLTALAMVHQPTCNMGVASKWTSLVIDAQPHCTACHSTLPQPMRCFGEHPSNSGH